MTTACRPPIAIAAAIEHLDHARRRARLEVRAPLHQLADVDGMKAVHVLVGIDRVEDALRRVLPHRRRQRRLDQDAVVRDRCAFSDRPAQQLVERRGGRQPLQIDPQSGVGARLDLVADVDLRRGVFADQDDAEPRRPPGARRERLHARASRRSRGSPRRSPFRRSARARSSPSRSAAPLSSVLEASVSAEHDQVVPRLDRRFGLRVEVHLAVGAADADDHDAEALPQPRVDQAASRERRVSATCTCSRFSPCCSERGRQLHEVDHRRPERRLRELQAAEVIGEMTRLAPARVSFVRASSLSARPTMNRSGLSRRALSTA